jgi:hypothetical protein
MSKTNEKQNILIIEMVNNENINIINQYLSHNEYTYTYIFIDDITINNDFLNIPLSCVKVFLMDVLKDEEGKREYIKKFFKIPFGCLMCIVDDLEHLERKKNKKRTKQLINIECLINDFNKKDFHIQSFLRYESSVESHTRFFYDYLGSYKMYSKIKEVKNKFYYVIIIKNIYSQLH